MSSYQKLDETQHVKYNIFLLFAQFFTLPCLSLSLLQESSYSLILSRSVVDKVNSLSAFVGGWGAGLVKSYFSLPFLQANQNLFVYCVAVLLKVL